MSEITADQRVASKLGAHPDHVGIVRNQFNDSPEGAIIRAIMADRLDQLFAERIRKLRKCNAEELPKIQGEADAFELSASTVTNRLE